MTEIEGYSGPGPLTLSSSLTTWTVDVVAVACVVAAAIVYARGVAAVGRHGGRWRPLRTISFASGLLVVVVATCSALGVYAHVLFWMYVLQACVLLLVAPILLGVGAPFALAAAAAGPGGTGRVDRWTATPLVRVARVPGFGPAVLIVATSVLFFTPLTPLSLQHEWLGEVVRLGLILAGLVMVLPVTDDHLSLSSVAYAAALALALVEFLLDALPGIVLRLQTGVLHADYWTGPGRPWGPSPIEDQHLAGAVLWFFGEAGDIPFIAALLAAWVVADAREARAVDRALDQEAPVLPPGTSVPVVADADRQRPWWETDPSVLGVARARRNGWGGGSSDGS